MWSTLRNRFDRLDAQQKDFVFLIVLSGGYVLTAYLFSFLVVTPLFVLAWGFWADLDAKAIVVILIIVMAFYAVLMLVFYIPLDRGKYSILTLVIDTVKFGGVGW